MYVSSSRLYFHAYILGVETKVVVELADIKELKKEKSGVLFDSIKVVTKSNQEVLQIQMSHLYPSIIFQTCFRETILLIYWNI